MIVAIVLLLAPPLHADRLSELLLDVDQARQFARNLSNTILVAGIAPKASEFVDPESLVAQPALVVAVRDHVGAVRLLTSGMLTRDAGRITVRLPSGKLQTVKRRVSLGDGSLTELLLPKALLAAEFKTLGFELAPASEVIPTLPVFTVINSQSDFPVLVKGAVRERLAVPWESFVVSDFRFPYGTPLVTTKGQLAAICFRRHPEQSDHSLAVTSEALGAWLRPKDKTANR